MVLYGASLLEWLLKFPLTTLWQTNMAIENGWNLPIYNGFMLISLLKMVIFQFATLGSTLLHPGSISRGSSRTLRAVPPQSSTFPRHGQRNLRDLDRTDHGTHQVPRPRMRWSRIPRISLVGILQGGAPPVISWFIIPINYRYNPHKP